MSRGGWERWKAHEKAPYSPRVPTGLASLLEAFPKQIQNDLYCSGIVKVDVQGGIQWREAGYSNLSISLMWSEAVVAEVVVFFSLGPWLIARLGLAGAATLSAGAGVLRWSVMANTTAAPALVCVQSLHGLTFALMHLAAMGIIARAVSDRLAATAQTVYGTGALGIASATMTFASGYLYGLFGLHAFWAMAAVCAVAIPLSRGLYNMQ